MSYCSKFCGLIFLNPRYKCVIGITLHHPQSGNMDQLIIPTMLLKLRIVVTHHVGFLCLISFAYQEMFFDNVAAWGGPPFMLLCRRRSFLFCCIRLFNVVLMSNSFSYLLLLFIISMFMGHAIIEIKEFSNQKIHTSVEQTKNKEKNVYSCRTEGILMYSSNLI